MHSAIRPPVPPPAPAPRPSPALCICGELEGRQTSRARPKGLPVLPQARQGARPPYASTPKRVQYQTAGRGTMNLCDIDPATSTLALYLAGNGGSSSRRQRPQRGHICICGRSSITSMRARVRPSAHDLPPSPDGFVATMLFVWSEDRRMGGWADGRRSRIKEFPRGTRALPPSRLRICFEVDTVGGGGRAAGLKILYMPRREETRRDVRTARSPFARSSASSLLTRCLYKHP